MGSRPFVASRTDSAPGRRRLAPAASAMLAAAILSASGCGGGPGGAPTAPTPVTPTLSGTWTGPLRETSARAARLLLVVDERPVLNGAGTALSGTWSLHFDADGRTDSGTLTGSVNAGQAAIGLDPSSRPACASEPGSPPGAGTWSLLVSVSPTRLSGSSLFIDCSSSSVGVVELSR